MFMVILKYHIKIRAPVNARGTVIITIIGSLKLSNCAERTRNINTIARMNANIKLDELSIKSFESPSRAVLKVSSSTFDAMMSISSIPWLIDLPGARLADIVADTNLLYRYNSGGAVVSLKVTKLSS